MKIVIPMAGHGSRFINQGTRMPKPLIQVGGRPMIAWALESIANIQASQIIFIVLREHEERYKVTSMLRDLVDTSLEVVLLDSVTEGQLCSVLAAREFIATDEDILICSSDTNIVSDLWKDINNRSADCHGIISVADLPGNRWSFARTDKDGQVVEVAEKVRISNHASTGLYYFSHGRELVVVADEMISQNAKTRGEYYVIPVYQKFIERGWLVRTSVAEGMWDMGTPEALSKFEEHIISKLL
jgi:UDP-N-acetylglucosamine diphosphorylase / glucose-1-phosphate thymidylyltransferase / UDP-N-acetylgalactosamine diphosphorylase / glucosamine-1-phosphate N-acetyltransferase / galactosamine-1-phosphate N-acetyltransferase